MNEQAPQENRQDDYAHLLDPNAPMVEDVEQAAVRPAVDVNPVTTETQRQMGIAAADHQNRADAGLPPRVHDLK